MATSPITSPRMPLSRSNSPELEGAPVAPAPRREANCSTFFLGDGDDPTHVEYNWCGEPLGLELQRPRLKELNPIMILWREGSVGITFGIEQATRKVVVKRTSRKEHDVAPGYILLSVNGQSVWERNFDFAMRELKIGHEAGRTQSLEFIAPPPPPLVKAVPANGVLERAGVNSFFELKSINGIQTRYLSLEQISTLMRQTIKPCVICFALSPEAQELANTKAAITTGRVQTGASLAVAAVFAAVCI
ncbi:hypothetical protein SPRG_01562 [Saprolegnia parasitica CBS 223.65]|uniref:PDZ domain-containing protein n=1 Tax=Saprolegnia parasitica (strain CBS 223.65) TaxID=695850 RepID=A0A067D5Y5_SAPPC|nr:hypothetical protein SPRG_01562 [Saprolegnia parasitica CBS 223.65]KDO34427.1 hypothetical protein SPRG_01562 [Saprolegnia parasitica CBS 223.65]|eukprot:XP_012195158.1 hypothetical protein SPRG_01562 [Saprolegnia parasitica CBS 223.65]